MVTFTTTELILLAIAALLVIVFGMLVRVRHDTRGEAVEQEPEPEPEPESGPVLDIEREPGTEQTSGRGRITGAVFWLLKGALTIGGILVFSVSFVGALFFPPPWNTYLLYVFLLGAGAALVPATVYLFGKSLGGWTMTPLARILFTIAAITGGGLAIDLRDYGRQEAQLLRQNDDGGWQVYRDGEWVTPDDGIGYLTRLGKKPFALTYEKTDRTFGKWLANIQKEDTYAITDGGSGDHYELDIVRGGWPQVSPVDVVEGSVDGIVIRMEAVRNSLRGAGGTGIADKAEEEAMKDFGGNTDMQTKIFLAYIVTMGFLAILAAGWTL